MNLFNELIQISLNTRTDFSIEPTYDDWIYMYKESDRHCIVGITFDGVDKYIKSHGGINNTNVDTELFASWYSFVQKIEEKNIELNKKSAWLQNWLSKQNMNTCILKGQGNALLYPNHLHRTSGDIDIWTWIKDISDGNENRTRIIEWVKNKINNNTVDVVLHHIQFPKLDDVEVEAHFWPSFFFSYPTTVKFHKWCELEHLNQMNNWKSIPNYTKQISVPTTEFNLVFQLIHMLRHLFAEGIGHRHLIDYYYTLNSDSCNKEDVIKNIKHFNLYSFASGIMWVMKEIYNMPESKLLLEPNEKIGKLIIFDVERAGNFGHADKKMMSKLELSKSKLFLWRTYRSFQVFRLCPLEVVYGPIFRVYQWLWIKKIVKQ